MGLAQVTTEWPDTWSRSHSGMYHANVAVDLASLSGAGVWKVFIMNAWSLSERMEYDMTIGLKFQGLPRSKTGGSCSPTMSPTPFDTAAPTSSMEPSASPTTIREGNAQYVIPINKVALGVHDDGMALVQDHITLHTFSFTGFLTAIELNLDPYVDGYETRGTNAWLLAVAVTDPWGLVAQVGGSSWRKQQSDFYSRNWPDPWLGRMSEGRPWVGSRDVHAAGLINSSMPIRSGFDVYYNDDNIAAEIDGYYDNLVSTEQDDSYYSGDDEYYSNHRMKPKAFASPNLITPKPPGLWSVELAMGYPWTIRFPVNYSGAIILHFKDTLTTGIIHANPSSPFSYKNVFNSSNNLFGGVDGEVRGGSVSTGTSVPVYSDPPLDPSSDIGSDMNIPNDGGVDSNFSPIDRLDGDKNDNNNNSDNSSNKNNAHNSDSDNDSQFINYDSRPTMMTTTAPFPSPNDNEVQGPTLIDGMVDSSSNYGEGTVSKDEENPSETETETIRMSNQNITAVLEINNNSLKGANVIAWCTIIGTILLLLSLILYILFQLVIYKKKMTSGNSYLESVNLLSVEMTGNIKRAKGDDFYKIYDEKIQTHSAQKSDRHVLRKTSAQKYGSIDV